MNRKLYKDKRNYSPPLIEIIPLGKQLSILSSNSVMLTGAVSDYEWEVDELEDQGEL